MKLSGSRSRTFHRLCTASTARNPENTLDSSIEPVVKAGRAKLESTPATASFQRTRVASRAYGSGPGSGSVRSRVARGVPASSSFSPVLRSTPRGIPALSVSPTPPSRSSLVSSMPSIRARSMFTYWKRGTR